jgi:hypothetical protein
MHTRRKEECGPNKEQINDNRKRSKQKDAHEGTKSVERSDKGQEKEAKNTRSFPQGKTLRNMQ